MGIYIKNLPDDARSIKDSLCWADRSGNIYGIETRTITLKDGSIAKHKHYGEYFKYSLFTNKHTGYVYCSIKYISGSKAGRNVQRRVHILIAETFLENPHNYLVVGHKNNIKSDNRVENLYWTTYKENTQKAVDDSLLINDKGYADSQSMPVVMFDTYTNKELGRYGSVSIASEETGHSKTTILRQARYKTPVRKPFYFRFQNDADLQIPTIVVRYDFESDKELGRYWNTQEAERQTGVNMKTIAQQCHNYRKPNWTKDGTYFMFQNE